jgi:hypothetical protein
MSACPTPCNGWTKLPPAWGVVVTEQKVNASVLITDEDAFLKLERSRLQALVARNMDLARLLHAIDFQLITPTGHSYLRNQYLHEIETGQLKYIAWDPEEMQIRMHANVTLLRYQARLEVDSGRGQASIFHCWHTDSYELIDGLWQVVWSQATAIR